MDLSQFNGRFFTYIDFTIDRLGKTGQGEDVIWQELARLELGPGMPANPHAAPQIKEKPCRQGLKSGLPGRNCLYLE